MTEKTKHFLRSNWQTILVGIIIQFVVVFGSNISAYKVYTYRIEQVENSQDDMKRLINDEIKPNVDILSWMHGIGTRDAVKNDHKHKIVK